MKQEELEYTGLEDNLKCFGRSFLSIETEGVESVWLVEDDPGPDPVRAWLGTGRSKTYRLEGLGGV